MRPLSVIAACLKRSADRRVRSVVGHKPRQALPSLWLMTDAARLPDPILAITRLPRGSGIILRHLDPSQRHALARTLVPLCRRRGLVVVIANDWRLAAVLKADGLHLSEAQGRSGDLGARLWRRQNRCARRSGFLTVAAHSENALRRGAAIKADAILLSPVFATASHPGARAMGPLRFAALAHASKRPVFALGGIGPRTAIRLSHSAAAGIAGIGWASN